MNLRHPGILRCTACICLVCVAAACSSAFAESVIAERETKAETIYKLLQFVKFPEDAFLDGRQPITVCILGHDPFGRMLEFAFSSKRIDGRPVNIIRAESLSALKRSKAPYHVVYVTKSLQEQTVEIISYLSRRNCLIIGETTGFCRQGGMVQLRVFAKRAIFSVNTNAVRRADLKISSQFLKLATIVETGPQLSRTGN